MVESASIAAIIVDIIICIGLPIGCLIVLLVKRQRPLVPFFAGLAVYIVFQLFLRVTVIGVLAPTDWYTDMQKSPWLNGLFVGITAGLFAELGRFAGIKLLLKNKNRWVDGVSLGTGYAGFESIAIGGLNYISSLVLANMINSGQVSQIADVSGSEAVNQVVTSLTTTPSIDIFFGGLERIFVFAIHIALSLLVLLAVRERKLIYLGAAILAHLFIDGISEAVAFSSLLYIVYTGVLAALSVVFIVMSRKQFSPPDQATASKAE